MHSFNNTSTQVECATNADIAVPLMTTKPSSSCGCKAREKLLSFYFVCILSIKKFCIIHLNCDIQVPEATTSIHSTQMQLLVMAVGTRWNILVTMLYSVFLMYIANFQLWRCTLSMAIVWYLHTDRILSCLLNHLLPTTIAIKDGKKEVKSACSFLCLEFFCNGSQIFFKKMNASSEIEFWVTASNLSKTTAIAMQEWSCKVR